MEQQFATVNNKYKHLNKKQNKKIILVTKHIAIEN